MNVIHDSAQGRGAARAAVVMLPGAGGRAQDLVDHGFVAALRARNFPVDAMVVDAGFDHYLERDVVVQLERDVIGPARERGAAHIWLMGISLGGLGALSYAREHAGSVEGIVLLAPFLGTRGLIAEISRAGGLRQWQPGTDRPDDDERHLLAWLREYRTDSPGFPPIWLGYGTEDRYAPASRLLVPQLPGDHVTELSGGHDWETWLKLWERWLDARLLSGPAAETSRGASLG